MFRSEKLDCPTGLFITSQRVSQDEKTQTVDTLFVVCAASLRICELKQGTLLCSSFGNLSLSVAESGGVCVQGISSPSYPNQKFDRLYNGRLVGLLIVNFFDMSKPLMLLI
jgi:hypothetical protein